MSDSRFRCAPCGHIFTEGEALCEDWTDPARSFLCPSCGERLVRAERVDATLVPSPLRLRARLRRWQRELALGAAVVCIALFAEPAFGERAAVAVLAIGAFVVALLALSAGGTRVQDTLPASLLDARPER
jgi:rubredoxin